MGRADDAIVTSERFMHFKEKGVRKWEGLFPCATTWQLKYTPNKQKEHLHANRKQIIVWMNRVEDVKVYSNHGSTNFRYNLILVKMKKCLLMFVVSR